MSLPSLPHVDAVLGQGGSDDVGIAQAFTQYGGDYADKMPIIEGGGGTDFVKWWADENKKNGYQTISMNTTPGIGGAALLARRVAARRAPRRPKLMIMPVATVDCEQPARIRQAAGRADHQPDLLARLGQDRTSCRSEAIADQRRRYRALGIGSAGARPSASEMQLPDSRMVAGVAAMRGRASGPVSSRCRAITKAFGPTLANADIDFAVAPPICRPCRRQRRRQIDADAHLLRCHRADAGSLSPSTAPKSPFSAYEHRRAHSGAASAWCIRNCRSAPTLSVAENFFIETPGARGMPPGWRAHYRDAARAALDAVFPGNAIDVDARDRPSVHRRAADGRDRPRRRDARRPSDRPRRADVLARSRALATVARLHPQPARARPRLHLHQPQAAGNHRRRLPHRRAAQRPCRLARRVSESSVGRLVELMGGDASPPFITGPRHVPAARTKPCASAAVRRRTRPRLSLQRGEIVGLGGPRGPRPEGPAAGHLRGTGQLAAGVTRFAPASFVSGDRQKEGVFPLWSVLANIAIGRIASRRALGLVSDQTRAPTPRRRPQRLAPRRRAVSTPTFLSSAEAISKRRSWPGRSPPLRPIILLGRPDARRRHRHQAGFLPALQRTRPRGTHARLAHHRRRRIARLRPRAGLCEGPDCP